MSISPTPMRSPLSPKIDAEPAGRGEFLGALDLIIVATAIHHRLTLVIRDVRHFSGIPDLRVESY